MVELDVPAMIHVSASCNPNFHTTCAHYLNADTTAFMQLLTSDLFKDFPTLKFVIPHGGGAVPYHWGRYRGIAQDLKRPPLQELLLNNVFFDTCVYHQPGIELLLKVIPADNILFASEMVGAIRGIDPQTGHYFDDTKRYIDAIDWVSADDKRKIFETNARRVYSRYRGLTVVGWAKRREAARAHAHRSAWARRAYARLCPPYDAFGSGSLASKSLERILHPGAVDRARFGRRHGLFFRLMLGRRRGIELLDLVERNAKQAVVVADDQVARLDHHAVDCDPHVDLARPVLVGPAVRHARGIHRKAAGADRPEVADGAIDHDAGHSDLLRVGEHQLADQAFVSSPPPSTTRTSPGSARLSAA